MKINIGGRTVKGDGEDALLLASLVAVMRGDTEGANKFLRDARSRKPKRSRWGGVLLIVAIIVVFVAIMAAMFAASAPRPAHGQVVCSQGYKPCDGYAFKPWAFITIVEVN